MFRPSRHDPVFVGLFLPGCSLSLVAGRFHAHGGSEQAIDALLITGVPVLVADGVISEVSYRVVDLDLMVDVELVIQLLPLFITWTTQITRRVQVHVEIDHQLVLFVLAQSLQRSAATGAGTASTPSANPVWR
jgi:hypothetical protein